MRTTEAVGHIRQSQDDPRTIEGIVVPYGQVAASTEIGREAFAPGAFRDSAAAWMSRTDGARLPFRPAHGQRNIGSVTHIEDTPAGLSFRARIRDGQRGDDYLSELSDGMNGVSVEFAPAGDSRKTRDGVTVHRAAVIFGIAGSEAPAYDGARIATRDMEEVMAEIPTPPEPIAPEPVTDEPARGAVPPISNRERVELERSTVPQFADTQARITRPEAVYGRGSEFNYMRDTWAISGMSRIQDKADAGERIRRHEAHLYDIATAMERDAWSRVFDPGVSERAGDLLSSEIPGAYPNDYLPGLLTPRIFKGRPMADSFQRIPIADARPRIFPKVTTSGTVATFAEGVAPTATDIATTAVTVTPAAYGTFIDVSRQALDGADPSALAIVFQDLTEAYRQASETAVKVAVEAGATASGVAITAATPWAGELANVVNYFATRFRPCEVAEIPSANYSTLLSQGDTTGRPFMPMIGQVNSDGSVRPGGIAGDILGATAKLSWSSTANVNVFAVESDYVIFESAITQFTYDQVVGPQFVRVGLWAYLGIGTRLGGLKVTAA